jgi:hypothetical protein
MALSNRGTRVSYDAAHCQWAKLWRVNLHRPRGRNRRALDWSRTLARAIHYRRASTEVSPSAPVSMPNLTRSMPNVIRGAPDAPPALASRVRFLIH